MDQTLQGILEQLDKALDVAGLQLEGADKEHIQQALVTQMFQRLLVATVEQISPQDLEAFRTQSQALLEQKNFQGLSELMHKHIPNLSKLVKQEANAFLKEFIQHAKAEAKS